MEKLSNKTGGAEYLSNIQDVFKRTCLKIYAEMGPQQARIVEILTKTIAMEGSAPESKSKDEAYNNFVKRSAEYERIFNSLSPEDQEQLMIIDAKSNDLGRSIRKLASRQIVEASHDAMKDKKGGENADKFLFTLKRFEKEGVSAEYVQKCVDEMITDVSLTPHPTNPTDVLHTKQGIKIENMLEDPKTKPEQLRKAIEEYFTSPISSGKKTPNQETEETIVILDNMYDSVNNVRKSLESGLKESGYMNKGVRVKKPVLNVCTWAAGGDGDGNPNYTAEVLKDGISALRGAIKQRYLNDLDTIIEKLPQDDKKCAGAIAELSRIREGLAGNIYKSPNDLEADIDQLAKHSATSARNLVGEDLENLAYKVKTFGFHYAKIDVRHDAASLAMKEGEAAERIKERMKVVADNPEMFSKLIIAECKTADDIKNALGHLKAAGYKKQPGSTGINIVPLFESEEDLRKAPEILRELLKDPEFAAYVNDNGGLMVQIAQSDTRRRAGMGASEVIYETIGNIIKLNEELPEILRKTLPAETAINKDISVRVFEGGGSAFARGAEVKITEIGATQGYVAKRGGASTLHAPVFTAQGHQCRLLLSSTENASYMLEGIMSQNMYAKAAVEGEVAPVNQSPEKDKLQTQARADAKTYYREARKEFREYSSNPSFDGLFKKGAWLSVIASNLSSRPSKRGGKDGGEGQTVAEIVGDNPCVLQQRAITADNLTRLSGTFPLALLGQKEALEAVVATQKEKGRAVNNMYENSKPDRNHIRALAIMLHTVNFKKLWTMSGMERPPSEEVEKIAATFDKTKLNSELATLCFMEQYSHDVAKLVYEAVSGKSPEKTQKFKGREFTTRDVLRETWPSLAHELEETYRRIELADVVEASLNKKLNADPNHVVTNHETNLLRAAAASTTMRNVPEGMLGVYTAKGIDKHGSEIEPENGNGHSHVEKVSSKGLVLPPVMLQMAEEVGVSLKQRSKS